MKKWAYLGLVATLALSLAACGGGGGGDTTETTGGKTETSAELADEQVFHTVVEQEISSADLSLNTDVVGGLVLNNIYEGMYRFDENNELVPAGAIEDPEVSDDGLTYTFKLREESKWSNGDPVTADDYVYGWQRTVNPETKSEFAYLHSIVKNGEAIANGDMDPSELGIKALSDYELEVELEVPTPYFMNLLTFSTYFPQHKETVEEYGDEFASTSEKAVYNGPFILTEFDGPGTDTDWTYKKNDTYWDKDNVKLETITAQVQKEGNTALNLYQAGDVDDIRLTGELAQQMADDPDLVIEKQASTYYLELNQIEKDSIFRNKDVRKAISLSIDREAIAANILGDGSVAASGLVPSEMMFDPKTEKDFAEEAGNQLDFDSKKAKEHWEKAKKDLGKDEIEVEILASDADWAKKVAEYLQGVLEENLDGLKVSVSAVPLSVRIDRSNNGEFDIVVGGWSADYADSSSFQELFTTGNSYNRGHYSNKEYDEKVKEAATTYANDPEKRFATLVEAEKIIMGDLGVVPLYQTAEAHLRSPQIKGVAIHPAGASYDYKWAYRVAE